MPEVRFGPTRTFRLRYKHKDGTEDTMQIYLTANTYPDGSVGEVFIKCDRMGSMARGLLDGVGQLVSLMLQYGIPLQAITEKLRHMRFEPNGFTGEQEFRMCSSVLDLIAQWLEARFGKRDDVA